MFSLLKLTFSLLLRPHSLSLRLRTNVERSPTDAITHSLKDCCCCYLLLLLLPTDAAAAAAASKQTFKECVIASYSFGKLLSPIHFRRRITRPVSYYALFKGLLLLSKPPLPLSNYLGALTSNLGCFPLDIGVYPPMSHWLTKYLSIQSSP